MNDVNNEKLVKDMSRSVVTYNDKVYVAYIKLSHIVGTKHFEDMSELERTFMSESSIKINSIRGPVIEAQYAIDALNECVNCDHRIGPFLDAIQQESDKLAEQILLKEEASRCDIDSLFNDTKNSVALFEEPAPIVADIKVFDMSMTSRQIAEVTEKDHKNVLRDIKTMIDRGDISRLNFEPSDYMSERGKIYQEYILDFDATMTVITGYDASRRKAVITRWRELEQGKAKPMYEVKIPTQIELARQVVELLESNEKKDNLINGFIESQKYHTAQGIGRVLVESGIRGSQIIVMEAARNMNMVVRNNFGKNVPTEYSIANGLMADTDEQQTPRFTKSGTKKIIDHFSK